MRRGRGRRRGEGRRGGREGMEGGGAGEGEKKGWEREGEGDGEGEEFDFCLGISHDLVIPTCRIRRKGEEGRERERGERRV
jgi:hypothetical protein